MMERLRKWWMKVQGEVSVEDSAIEREHSSQELSDIKDQELTETRALLKDSSAKLAEADTRIKDYQDRIRREYRKRLEVASGGRLDDRDR